jgi:hypothetical protein
LVNGIVAAMSLKPRPRLPGFQVVDAGAGEDEVEAEIEVGLEVKADVIDLAVVTGTILDDVEEALGEFAGETVEDPAVTVEVT